MAQIRRLTLYLRRHHPEEQALYRYLMRKTPSERTALHRNMILAEFRRRLKRERSSPKADAAQRPRTTAPPTTGPLATWNQPVTL
jgi:hypothetical protein